MRIIGRIERLESMSHGYKNKRAEDIKVAKNLGMTLEEHDAFINMLRSFSAEEIRAFGDRLDEMIAEREREEEVGQKKAG